LGHVRPSSTTYCDATNLWLFSSGPVGDPPKPPDEAPEALKLAHRLGARGHRRFSGRLERSHLNFLERTITKALRAPDGDFRDREEVMAWSGVIVAELARAGPGMNSRHRTTEIDIDR
jgi:menaquinone-dependent protoporphyrinogen oxidase